MKVEFSGSIWFWKGPAPWYFVTVPEDECGEIAASSSFVTYGWGMIPVSARVGRTAWTTSLFCKNGRYVVPLKTAVRTAERLNEGDMVTIRLTIDI